MKYKRKSSQKKKSPIFYLAISIIVASLLIAISSIAAQAAESADIDPSDMTNVYSSVALAINSDENVRTTANFGGAWNDDHRYLAVLEGFWGDREEGDEWGSGLINYRAQYFHVIKTE